MTNEVFDQDGLKTALLESIYGSNHQTQVTLFKKASVPTIPCPPPLAFGSDIPKGALAENALNEVETYLCIVNDQTFKMNATNDIKAREFRGI